MKTMKQVIQTAVKYGHGKKPVKYDRQVDAWYIEYGYPGYGGRTNNTWGYQTLEKAEAAILHFANR